MKSKKGNQVIEIFTLRESYFLLAFRIISLELVFVFALSLLRIIFDLLGGSDLANSWVYYLAFTVFVHLINIGLLLNIVFRWVGLIYLIKPNELAIKNGVFNSRTVSYDLSALQSITFNQTLIGKLFNFGTVKLYNPVLREDVFLTNIHNPTKYIEVIKDYKQGNVGILPRIRVK